MKKAMVLCALLIGFGVHAQHRSKRHAPRGEAQTQLSPEERATIQSKRMTLALGLDQRQQDQMTGLLKQRLEERAELRQRRKSEADSGTSADSENRFDRLNAHLDRKIAFQEELRGILSERQFEKWQTQRERQMAKRQRQLRHRDIKHARRRG